MQGSFAEVCICPILQDAWSEMLTLCAAMRSQAQIHIDSFAEIQAVWREYRAHLQKFINVLFCRMRGVEGLLCRCRAFVCENRWFFCGNTGLVCRNSYMCCFAGCVEWKAYFVRMHIGLLYGNRAFMCGNAGLFCGHAGLFCRHSYVCTMLQDVWSGMPTSCATMSCRRAQTSPQRFPSPHYKRAFI